MQISRDHLLITSAACELAITAALIIFRAVAVWSDSGDGRWMTLYIAIGICIYSISQLCGSLLLSFLVRMIRLKNSVITFHLLHSFVLFFFTICASDTGSVGYLILSNLLLGLFSCTYVYTQNWALLLSSTEKQQIRDFALLSVTYAVGPLGGLLYIAAIYAIVSPSAIIVDDVDEETLPGDIIGKFISHFAWDRRNGIPLVGLGCLMLLAAAATFFVDAPEGRVVVRPFNCTDLLDALTEREIVQSKVGGTENGDKELPQSVRNSKSKSKPLENNISGENLNRTPIQRINTGVVVPYGGGSLLPSHEKKKLEISTQKKKSVVIVDGPSVESREDSERRTGPDTTASRRNADTGEDVGGVSDSGGKSGGGKRAGGLYSASEPSGSRAEETGTGEGHIENTTGNNELNNKEVLGSSNPLDCSAGDIREISSVTTCETSGQQMRAVDPKFSEVPGSKPSIKGEEGGGGTYMPKDNIQAKKATRDSTDSKGTFHSDLMDPGLIRSRNNTVVFKTFATYVSAPSGSTESFDSKRESKSSSKRHSVISYRRPGPSLLSNLKTSRYMGVKEAPLGFHPHRLIQSPNKNSSTSIGTGHNKQLSFAARLALSAASNRTYLASYKESKEGLKLWKEVYSQYIPQLEFLNETTFTEELLTTPSVQTILDLEGRGESEVSSKFNIFVLLWVLATATASVLFTTFTNIICVEALLIRLEVRPANVAALMSLFFLTGSTSSYLVYPIICTLSRPFGGIAGPYISIFLAYLLEIGCLVNLIFVTQIPSFILSVLCVAAGHGLLTPAVTRISSTVLPSALRHEVRRKQLLLGQVSHIVLPISAGIISHLSPSNVTLAFFPAFLGVLGVVSFMACWRFLLTSRKKLLTAYSFGNFESSGEPSSAGHFEPPPNNPSVLLSITDLKPPASSEATSYVKEGNEKKMEAFALPSSLADGKTRGSILVMRPVLKSPAFQIVAKYHSGSDKNDECNRADAHRDFDDADGAFKLPSADRETISSSSEDMEYEKDPARNIEKSDTGIRSCRVSIISRDPTSLRSENSQVTLDGDKSPRQSTGIMDTMIDSLPANFSFRYASYFQAPPPELNKPPKNQKINSFFSRLFSRTTESLSGTHFQTGGSQSPRRAGPLSGKVTEEAGQKRGQGGEKRTDETGEEEKITNCVERTNLSVLENPMVEAMDDMLHTAKFGLTMTGESAALEGSCFTSEMENASGGFPDMTFTGRYLTMDESTGVDTALYRGDNFAKSEGENKIGTSRLDTFPDSNFVPFGPMEYQTENASQTEALFSTVVTHPGGLTDDSALLPSSTVLSSKGADSRQFQTTLESSSPNSLGLNQTSVSRFSSTHNDPLFSTTLEPAQNAGSECDSVDEVRADSMDEQMFDARERSDTEVADNTHYRNTNDNRRHNHISNNDNHNDCPQNRDNGAHDNNTLNINDSSAKTTQETLPNQIPVHHVAREYAEEGEENEEENLVTYIMDWAGSKAPAQLAAGLCGACVGVPEEELIVSCDCQNENLSEDFRGYSSSKRNERQVPQTRISSYSQ